MTNVHYLAVGLNAWGKGASVREAKANCKRAGAPAKAVYKVTGGKSYVDVVDGSVTLDEGAWAEQVWPLPKKLSKKAKGDAAPTTDAYFVRSKRDLCDGTSYGALVRASDGVEVAYDCFAPEDGTFARSLAPLVDELNRLAAELEKAKK